MPRQSQSKLLKGVAEQAQLMRAPFRSCSWTKKPARCSIFKQTGEKFRSKLTKLSVSKTWADVEEEWVVLKRVQLIKQREQCLCGKGNLKFVTYLKNIRNNQEVVSGNCCLLTIKRYRL